MEAVWLAALAVVPVFFNIYSSRIFEPDKLAILRSLALVSLAAWAIKLIEQGGLRWEMEREAGESWFQTLRKTPLLGNAVLLIGEIVIATIFSVTPRVSFWGSYQRLQGTYTTLGYLVIFATIVANMRRREQVERLILTVILASLPVAGYGILQKFERDPIPWGGDVTKRIAANMGNSIFVAAYLILAFPLTLGKIVQSFTAILEDEDRVVSNVARGTVYVFTLSLQMIAIYFSGSRGPFLGWLAGLMVMLLLLSLYWNKRWLTLTFVGTAGAVLAFLIVFSIPNGPLENLKGQTGLDRLGNVFDVDSGTGRVRVLIWEGASKLVSPHDPLEYPDGKTDFFNFLRPVFGYGPESMYVAFNPFYPPELANIESRNASPDRSHNETWDAIVTTGFVGLIVYLGLFISIFYYGLSWLGMISTPGQRNLFLGLVLGGGLVSALGFVAVSGIGFFGVGLPYGMLVGLGIYLALISLFSRYTPPQTRGGKLRSLTLMMFLTAIIAHFGEIHLGIAIAATRSHFWAYAGVLIAVGFLMTRQGVYGDTLPETGETPAKREPSEPVESKTPSRKQKRTTRRAAPRTTHAAWSQFAILGGIITALLLSTLGYDFITNSKRVLGVGEIIWTSLSTLPNEDFQISYGILGMVITLWLAAGVLFTAENKEVSNQNWFSALGVTLGVSAGTSLLYWFIHAAGLAGVIRTAIIMQQKNEGAVTLEGIMAQAGALEGVLTTFYIFLIGLVLLLAFYVANDSSPRIFVRSGISLAAVFAIGITTAVLISYTNIRIIHADIAYKLADPFARGDDPNQWQYAIELYQRANQLAPSEDFYYLFLARAYLERARLLQNQDSAETQKMMEQAKGDLLLAQKINPLNTDHTANLARLYRFWSAISSDPAQRMEYAQLASDYYDRAVILSPNNVVIWNEWAALYLTNLQDPQQAVEVLMHSLQVDPEYFSTYAILAQYYAQTAQQAPNDTARQAAYDQAVQYYRDGVSHIRKVRDLTTKFNYLMELAGFQANFSQYEDAIATYEEALPIANNQVWRVEDALARLYYQLGQPATALEYANSALLNAPDNQKTRIQELIAVIQQPSP